MVDDIDNCDGHRALHRSPVSNSIRDTREKVNLFFSSLLFRFLYFLLCAMLFVLWFSCFILLTIRFCNIEKKYNKN